MIAASILFFMAPALAASIGFSRQASRRVEATIKSDAALEPFRTNASTHQREGQVTGIDACADPDFCSAREASASVPLAVYIYNLGNYDPIEVENIPCVPSKGMDAFFLVDNDTYEASKDVLDKWAEKGWTVSKLMSKFSETPQVSQERLTAKNLKFLPPSWLRNSSKYNWLVTFDSTLGLDLTKLSDFVNQDQHSDKSVILLKWYWANCTGYDCFENELQTMLNKPEYVGNSREETVEWKAYLDNLHSAEHISMPFYWETSVFMRNLRHEKASAVNTAFLQTYTKLHEIQRDQFVLPYFMEKNDLLPTIYSASLEELQTNLSLCMLNDHSLRNFETAHSK